MAVTAFFKRRKPTLRRLIQALFWVYLAMAPLFWFGVLDVYGHDQEWSLAPLAILSALALLLPSAAFALFAPKAKESAVARAEALIAFATVGSWIGAFGLYRVGLSYDTFIHLLNSAALTAAFALLLVSRGSHSLRSAVIAAAVFAFACGLANEAFEWSVDHVWKTGMYGEVGEERDTVYDLLGNAAGISVAGSLILSKRAKKSP